MKPEKSPWITPEIRASRRKTNMKRNQKSQIYATISGHKWSVIDDCWLWDNCNKLTSRELGKKLGRSLSSISSRLSKLGKNNQPILK